MTVKPFTGEAKTAKLVLDGLLFVSSGNAGVEDDALGHIRKIVEKMVLVRGRDGIGSA